MYSVSIMGSVRNVECNFRSPTPERVRLLSRTPICPPVPRQLLANVPILTGRFEEQEVIVGTMGKGDMDAWSFEVNADDLDFLQEQMNLPVCVLNGLDTAIYIARHRVRDEASVIARIRGEK